MTPSTSTPPCSRAGRGGDPAAQGRRDPSAAAPQEPPPTRGAAVARIAEIGRKAWKQETGYHRRSLAETGVYRSKTLIGPDLKARSLDNQKAEAAIAVGCVNRFTALGMPRSLRIA